MRLSTELVGLGAAADEGVGDDDPRIIAYIASRRMIVPQQKPELIE